MNYDELIKKYDKPGPRYTSYPPVPMWGEMPKEDDYFEGIQKSFDGKRVADLYLHIPFCNSICHYCGCNRTLKRNNEEVKKYLDRMLHEAAIYREKLGEFKLGWLHMGGGTPSILDEQGMRYLLNGLYKIIPPSDEFFASIEADPRTTTASKIRVWHELGVSRISFGVQDLNPDVGKAINRDCPVEVIENLVKEAREIGIQELNADLIYGLPSQKYDHILSTFSHMSRMMFETIAFYSYAHVPTFAQNQKNLAHLEIPEGTEKRRMYDQGRELLRRLGYVETGLDHFALPHSKLYAASMGKTLTRNFMGYTHKKSPVLLGFGASSISSTKFHFMQNEKEISCYNDSLSENKLPFIKGHTLDEQDKIHGEIIESVMCLGEADLSSLVKTPDLTDFANDGLITLENNHLVVTSAGRPFLRNIAMAFDERLSQTEAKFSRTI